MSLILYSKICIIIVVVIIIVIIVIIIKKTNKRHVMFSLPTYYMRLPVTLCVAEPPPLSLSL